MKRNQSIDLIKILACLGVIILHASGTTAQLNAAYKLDDFLYCGSVFSVPIFFMVNGYFLLNKEELEYRYVGKKIINIIEVVISWNLILFLVSLIFQRKIINIPKVVVENLLQGDYFWQFWFFGSLIIIYSVLPIIHRYFKDLKKSIIITISLIVICLCVDVINIILRVNGGKIIDLYFIQTLRVWLWFAYYFIGGLLGRKEIKDYILSKISFRANLIIFIVSFAASNIYEYIVATCIYRWYFIEHFYGNIFTFIFVISLFTFVYRINIKESRIISILSSSIMGVYIVHITVIEWCKRLYSFDTTFSSTILIFIVFILSGLISLIISKIPKVNRIIKL